MSPTHSWLFGVMVKTLDLESVGCELRYMISFVFWKEKPSLISLILNTKSEKHNCCQKIMLGLAVPGKSGENVIFYCSWYSDIHNQYKKEKT